MDACGNSRPLVTGLARWTGRRAAGRGPFARPLTARRASGPGGADVGTAASNEGDDEVLDLYLDYRHAEFRVDGRDIDPALGFQPPAAYRELEFALEPLWDDPNDGTDEEEEEDLARPAVVLGARGEGRWVERGWLSLCSSDIEFAMFCDDLYDHRLPIIDILRDKGIRYPPGASIDPLVALANQGLDGAGGVPGMDGPPPPSCFDALPHPADLLGAGGMEESLLSLRYLQATAEGDVDGWTLWGAVKGWMPRSVFALAFEHEGMMGLYCFKAVEEGCDLVRDIVPVFQDQSDADRFLDNVQPYLPLSASVMRVDASSAVLAASDLNAHLHVERPGSVLVPPLATVLATDLERAVELAKDRYTVLEGERGERGHWGGQHSNLHSNSHGYDNGAWSGAEAPRGLTAAAPGGGVEVFDLSDYTAQSTLSAMGLNLELLGIAGVEAPDSDDEGEAATEAVAEDEGEGGSDEEGGSEEGEGEGDEVLLGDRDIYVLHYEGGMIRVRGEPRGVPTWGEGEWGGREGGDARGREEEVPPFSASTSTASLLPLGASRRRGGGGVSLQELLRRGSENEALRHRIEERARMRGAPTSSPSPTTSTTSAPPPTATPALLPKPRWPPTHGRARALWAAQNSGACGWAPDANASARADADPPSCDGWGEGGGCGGEGCGGGSEGGNGNGNKSDEGMELRGVLITADGSRMDVRASRDPEGRKASAGASVSMGGGLVGACVVAQGIVFAGPVSFWEDEGDNDEDDDAAGQL